MTGISRLRALAERKNFLEPAEARELDAIADQIERERECDRDTIENLRLELGEARDPAADVSMNAYDLLPQEDRDAIAWVRDQGGLDAVKRRWECLSYYADPVPRAYAERRIASRQRQIDESHAALRRRNARIVESEQECDELREMVRSLNALTDEMEKRLMPEGMEWPRFEDGAQVKFGDVVSDGDETGRVYYVTFDTVNPVIIGFTDETPDQDPGTWLEVSVSDGERVKRPTPKVLDADGAEIEVGDDLYSVEGSLKLHVSHVDRTNGKIATDAMFSLDKWADPSLFTHRAPVLAADGRPLREGETVFDKDTGDRFEVNGFSEDGFVVCWDLDKCEADIEIKPSQLTHERPVVDTWERLEEDAEKFACEYFGRGGKKDTCTGCRSREIDPCTAKDCEFNKTIDLVRRAKALAERGR